MCSKLCAVGLPAYVCRSPLLSVLTTPTCFVLLAPLVSLLCVKAVFSLQSLVTSSGVLLLSVPVPVSL